MVSSLLPFKNKKVGMTSLPTLSPHAHNGLLWYFLTFQYSFWQQKWNMKQYPYFQHIVQLMALIELYKYCVPKLNILRPTNEGEWDEWLKESNGGWIDALFYLPKGPFIMKIIPNFSLICILLFSPILLKATQFYVHLVCIFMSQVLPSRWIWNPEGSVDLEILFYNVPSHL